MARDREKGSFAAEIPEDIIAEAMKAVEKVKEERGALDGAVGSTESPHEVTSQTELEDLRTQLSEVRRRVARDKDDVQRFAVEKLVKDLLPALDSLDRAVASDPAHPVSRGVAQTLKLLHDALGRHGLKSFSADPGAPFDPRLHQALLARPTVDRAAGTVVESVQRGYLLHDRLIRPAEVIVASAPAPSEDA